MPQLPLEQNERMSFRINVNDKHLLMRAASIEHANLTEFVVKNIVSAAKKIIAQNEKIKLSERDSLQVLDMLENPPEPNKNLLEAAVMLSKSS